MNLFVFALQRNNFSANYPNFFCEKISFLPEKYVIWVNCNLPILIIRMQRNGPKQASI